MFKAGELEAISMALEPQFRELEQRIMSDIVRRISINGEITRAADWQVTRLAQLGESKREIKKAIKDTLGLSTKEVNHLYKDVLRKGYERESELYKYKGRTQIPFAENHELQQLIGAVSKQTDGELKNITQSLGFAKRGADGKLEFTPVADYYQKTLDSAMLDISSGAFDYNTVLKRTVKEMTNSGLRSVDYATGHSNRVDVAARRALMTGMSQLTAKVNESNAEQLGTDMFETTAHGGARPEHQEWQGRWYTKDELESICGLGEVTGLCGANCYHDYYPVVPGISEPTYTAEQIEEFNRKENEPVEYNGKTYTKYEATQRQRKLETTMRAQRQEIKLLKEGGASEDDLIVARSRYRGTSAEYARFSKAMDLPQQRERVTVDGLGNIGQGKYKADTPSEAKQEAPQQTQDTQKGISPVEQNDAVQSSTEADNINNKSVDSSEESVIIKADNMFAHFEESDANAMKSLLEKAPNDIVEAINKCDGWFDIDPNYSQSVRGSHYSWADQQVRFEMNKLNKDMFSDVRGKNELFKPAYNEAFHEIGHAIDNTVGRNAQGGFWASKYSSSFISPSKGVSLADSLEKEVEKCIKTYGKDELSNMLKDMPLVQSADVSDIFGAFTNNEVVGYTGHPVEYWSGDDKKEKAASEAFAEMFSAEINNQNALEQFKLFFPDSYSIFKEIIAEIPNISIRR